jgi:hypothetical protein
MFATAVRFFQTTVPESGGSSVQLLSDSFNSRSGFQTTVPESGSSFLQLLADSFNNCS